MKKTIITCISFLVGSVFSLSAGVTTGEPAPDFTLTDTHGETHSLSDFEGKYVVLEWVNHQCPFVVRHYSPGNMQALQREVTGNGGVWLTINSSAVGKQGYTTPEEANALVEKHDAAMTAVLLDTDGTVGRLFGARVTPHMFVIAPDGILIYQGAIDSEPRRGTPDEAFNYVKAALEAHQAGEEIEHHTTRAYGCTVKY